MNLYKRNWIVVCSMLRHVLKANTKSELQFSLYLIHPLSKRLIADRPVNELRSSPAMNYMHQYIKAHTFARKWKTVLTESSKRLKMYTTQVWSHQWWSISCENQNTCQNSWHSANKCSFVVSLHGWRTTASCSFSVIWSVCNVTRIY